MIFVILVTFGVTVTVHVVDTPETFPFTVIIVVPSVNSDNDEYITADGESIEMNDIAVTDLLLQLPAKNLCREVCKGLCMVCGCDLNESECNCQKTDAFGLSRNGL